MLIGETTVAFEPDDEGSYRALADAAVAGSPTKINTSLLQAIAEKLVTLQSVKE